MSETITSDSGSIGSPKRPGPLVRDHVRAAVLRIQGGYLSKTGQAPTAASVQALATLRRVAGGSGLSDPRTWSLVLDKMPDELLGSSGGLLSEPNPAEQAVFTALTTYAVHQQSQRSQPMHVYGVGMGHATRRLARQRAHGQGHELDDGTVDRMHKISLAQTPELRAQTLRALVTLMRAVERPVPLDYGQLAEDLYWLQHPRFAHRVHLRWGRDLHTRGPDERSERDIDQTDEATGATP